MPFLPDTNVWISHLKQPGSGIELRLRSLTPGDVFLCSIVKAELWHGARKYGRSDLRLAILAKLFEPFESIAFDDEAARHCADIRHELEVEGALIGPNDLKIAAIARARGLTLVSSDKEFRRVSGLRFEDWTDG